MPDASQVNPESSHIFDLWFSQWRLAILDCNSAQSILSAVLNAMSARPKEDTFWECLREFLEAQDPVSAISPMEDPKVRLEMDMAKTPDMRRQLTERAALLPSRLTKRLLEHLASSYALHGDDKAFWHTVKKTLDLDRNSIPQPERASYPTI